MNHIVSSGLTNQFLEWLVCSSKFYRYKKKNILHVLPGGYGCNMWDVIYVKLPMLGKRSKCLVDEINSCSCAGLAEDTTLPKQLGATSKTLAIRLTPADSIAADQHLPHVVISWFNFPAICNLTSQTSRRKWHAHSNSLNLYSFSFPNFTPNANHAWITAGDTILGR